MKTIIALMLLATQAQANTAMRSQDFDAVQLTIPSTVTVTGQDASGYSMKLSSGLDARNGCLLVQGGQVCAPSPNFTAQVNALQVWQGTTSPVVATLGTSTNSLAGRDSVLEVWQGTASPVLANLGLSTNTFSVWMGTTSPVIARLGTSTNTFAVWQGTVSPVIAQLGTSTNSLAGRITTLEVWQGTFSATGGGGGGGASSMTAGNYLFTSSANILSGSDVASVTLALDVVASSEQYCVRADLFNSGGGSRDGFIRFNGDSSNVYHSVMATLWDNSANATEVHGAGLATYAVITDDGNSMDDASAFTINFCFATVYGDPTMIMFEGVSHNKFSGFDIYSTQRFGGRYNGSVAPFSVTIGETSGTFNGIVQVKKLIKAGAW